MTISNWTIIYPYIILLAAGMLTLILSKISSEKDKNSLFYLGVFSFIIFIFHCSKTEVKNDLLFGGMLKNDVIGFYSAILASLCGLAVLLISKDYTQNRKIPSGEYVSIILISAFALGTLSLSNELTTFLISIEIVSISFYILTALEKRSLASREAAFKYFILGSFSAGFLILGCAFIYGGTGTTSLDKISEALLSKKIISPLWITIGFFFMLVGIGFKLSLAPFHFWTAEIYEGAPTPITAYLATASKVSVFAFFFRLALALSNHAAGRADIIEALWWIALLTIIIGNLMALLQTKIKRLLAFSSIAHSGYITIVILAVFAKPEIQREASYAMMFYLSAYSFMNFLAFATMTAVGDRGDREIEEYSGLFERQPMLSVCMTLAMFSLTGIPPTVGFFGKFYVFKSALDAGFTSLAVAAVITSVISAFYYFRVVVMMFMKPSEKGIIPMPVAKGNLILLAILSFLIILFGIIPQIDVM